MMHIDTILMFAMLTLTAGAIILGTALSWNGYSHE
jgi:hypothetical protein